MESQDYISRRYVNDFILTLLLQTEETSSVFFEPSSPYYLITMIISAGLLIIATICGLFYHNLCYQGCLREMDEEGMWVHIIFCGLWS